MSRAALLLVVPMLLACTREEEAPMVDTAAMTTEAAPMNYAGTWTATVMPEARDTVLVTYDLVATNDRTGWRLMLPGRDPMDLRVVSMDGDSVVAEAGPYSSVLRPNVMVRTQSTFRVEGDRLTGTTIARYDTRGADSVVRLRFTGTRK